MPSLLDSPQTSSAPLFLVDDHDEAYRLWKSHSVQNKILLHFDAHIDFEWIADKDPLQVIREKSPSQALDELKNSYGWAMSDAANNFLHLGNYLCRALQEGMVREWYWIVPDSIWDNKATRHQIWRDLLQYYQYRTGPMEFPTKKKNSFEASFFNVPLIVTSLKHLPKIEEPVLLNVDVDYLTTEMLPEIPSAEALRRQLPWIWPDTFALQLKRAGIRSCMTTLSNSVQGGFTPIQFKFFGRALEDTEKGFLDPAYDRLKEAYEFYASRKDEVALAVLDSFESSGVYEATRLYRKSQILFSSGQIEAAQECMRKATAFDAEFASSYNSAAIYFETLNRPKDAYEEHHMIDALIPGHPEARVGKANYWRLSGAKEDAKAAYLQVLAENPSHAGAAQKLGSLFHSERNWPLAQQYLFLSLAQNPKNISARLQLASVYLKQRLFADAKEMLRETLGMGAHVPAAYFLLSKTYFGLGFLKKAAELYLEAWRLRLKIFFRNLGSRL